jgi:hypothetical protein
MENNPSIRDPVSDYMRNSFGVTIHEDTINFDKNLLVSLQSFEEVDVCILDIVTYILQHEAKNTEFGGMVSPSLLAKLTMEKQQLPPTDQITMEVNGVNLHQMANKYVVSLKKENEIIVYDSSSSSGVQSRTFRKKLFAQLTTIYGVFDENHVQFICPQEQGTLKKNCGKIISAFGFFKLNLKQASMSNIKFTTGQSF